MRRPHLLSVERPAAEFSALVAAVTAAGERVGWLEWGEVVPPPSLEEAASTGVLRAVAVGGGRTVSVKPVRGPAVLDDLLREHFSGCRLVLVRGGERLARLEPDGERWKLSAPPVERHFSTAALVAALGGARPLIAADG